MDQPVVLFHDPVDAESAIAQMDREGLTPARVVRAPGRVVLEEGEPVGVGAGILGAVLGVAAFVLLTVASVVVIDDAGPIDAGTYAFILFHAVLIGVGFGGGYGLTARYLMTGGEAAVTLHGSDVLVVGPNRRLERLRQIADRYDGRWIDEETLNR